MNYLAHIALSGADPLFLLGNFAGDFIKGRNLSRFPKRMQDGVIAHRFIDSFTDQHPIVKECSRVFQPVIGRYSGIVIDILFDHFLSVHWHQFYVQPLPNCISNTHLLLQSYSAVLPPRAQRMLASLRYQRYLSIYISYWGLQKVFRRMALRTSLPDVTGDIMNILHEQYQELELKFLSFYPDLVQNVDQKFGANAKEMEQYRNTVE